MQKFRWSLPAFLGLGCLLLAGVSASGQDVKKADKEMLLSKKDSLADNDKMDTKLKKPCKTYKVKLVQGKAYRIDLTSPDFDAFLRLEDSKGKEVAFNDDVDPANMILDSRIIYAAPKTGEYTIIASCFDGKTGDFTLEMKYASKEEAKEPF